MRELIAADLQVDVDAISVKATTNEKLGHLGREEGIAAHVVCLLVRACARRRPAPIVDCREPGESPCCRR